MYAEVVGFLVVILKTFSIPVFVFVAAFMAVKNQSKVNEAPLKLSEIRDLPITDPRARPYLENIMSTMRIRQELSRARQRGYYEMR